ncbi:MAG: ABC transporter substrate-binding protein [Clostridia bacterium]|nr:ABC transporter substrate-binding protein [Clostridia bacterium]
MKRIIALALACLMVLACFAGCGSKKADDVIYIGIYEPASGDNGAGGKQETLGIQYANTLVNTVTLGGKEYKIELVEVDNQSSTDKAISAASQLVSKGCSIVLGSYGSGVSIAAADTFANAKIPAIGCSCTNPAVTDGNEYYYRICYLDPFQGTVLANYAFEEKGETAYVLAQLGDDYSVGLATSFQSAYEALGGKVVYETFPEGTSDFTAYITSAKNAGADVMFAPTSTTSASLIISQAASNGAEYALMAGDTWESSVILDAAKGTNLDVSVSTFFDENDDTAAGKEFVTGFKAWLNANPDKLTNNGGNDIVAAVSALGFDGYMTAVEAIKAADSADSQAVADALGGVVYTGVTGEIKFDEIGDAVRNLAYIKTVDTVNGAFVFGKIQTIAD